MTTIAIIGTGLMARALGAGWGRAGHSIRIGARNPAHAAPEALGFSPDFVGDPAAALEGAQVVVLAIPFPAVTPFVSEHREALEGTTIIDISNPFDALPNNERAAVEHTADALGTTTGLVAAFKDNFAATIDVREGDERPDVKIAGDDEAAKAVAAALAEDLGHRALDCGPLHNARLLDPMVSLMLALDREYAGFTMRTGWRFHGLPAGAGMEAAR